MTLPLSIIAIGAGVLFALYLLFENQNQNQRRPLTYGPSESSTDSSSTYDDTHSFSSQNETEDRCAICWYGFNEEKEPIRILQCGHIFHWKCINEWFKNKRACPVCRKCA